MMIRSHVAAAAVAALLTVVPLAALADREAAQELIIQGRYDEAIMEINTLLAASPDDAELRFLKGIVYAEQGEDDQAIEIFAGLTQDYPELPEPYNNLAVLFAQRGEYDKARDALLAAIQTHPSYSTAHENLGDLYAKMAGNSYSRALQENESNESAKLKLAKMNALFAAPAQTAVASTTPTEQPSIATDVATTVTPANPEPPASTPEPSDPAPIVTADISEPAPGGSASADTAAATQQAANDVAATVGSWASAWSGQDVDAYLSHYAADFRPGRGLSRSAWAEQRRDRVTRPSFIEVEIEDLLVDVRDADNARAVFTQNYAATGYADTVVKTLTMRNVGGEWKIVREVSRAP